MVYAVDFDGVLCKDNFPNIGEPNFKMIEYVKNLKKQGHQVILWTCRNNQFLEQATLWCKLHNLEFDTINENLPENIIKYGGSTRKIFADYYIDDKNMFIEGIN